MSGVARKCHAISPDMKTAVRKIAFVGRRMDTALSGTAALVRFPIAGEGIRCRVAPNFSPDARHVKASKIAVFGLALGE
jgi:hypothetical protein